MTGASPASMRDRLIAGEESGRGALGVALDARELSGEERHRIVAQRQVRR